MTGTRYQNIKRGKWAHALAIFSIIVTTYYLIWRLGTLNHESMTFSVFLYAAEIYGFISTLMFYFTVWGIRQRQSLPPPPGLKVDIFIPTLNEDTALLRKTILGCLKITYPHRTYVLDDGKRHEVRALAKELGCCYIVRPDNSHAKAGNLNHALGVTQGDFIAIFDADHVPQPDFLDKLLGYFTDEKTAFVQTPQDFYNIDSFQHRTRRNKKIWSEQAMFFSLIQPGKDRWNAAFFCGSCAIIRRSALKEIGGVSVETITEDFHTSIKLHAAGWQSVYHNESLAYGIAPPVLYPFQIQRLRWGQGTTQVLRRDNALFIKGLSIPQRICYFASSIHYFDGCQKAIFYLVPIITLLTGLYPIKALNSEFILVFLPYFLFSLWAYEEMAGGMGSVLITEQYKMIMFYTYIRSLAGILKNKRLRFNVTPKTEFEKTKPKMMLPQIFIFAAGLFSVLWASLRVIVYNEANWELLVGSIFWVLINVGVAGASIHFARKKFQRRSDFRFPVNLPALIMSKTSGKGIIKQMVMVNDLNEGGASITGFTRLDVDDEAELQIPIVDRLIKIQVKIRGVNEAGGNQTNLFNYGVTFLDLDDESRKFILDFNFTYAVNRMMRDQSPINDTPLTIMLNKINKTFLPSRKQRFTCRLPGICKGGNNDGQLQLPFATEDINSIGMRFFSFGRIETDTVSIDLFTPDGLVTFQASVAWVKLIDYHGRQGWQYGVRFQNDIDKTSSLNKIISQVCGVKL